MEFTIDDMIKAFKAGVKVATTKSDEEIKSILTTLPKVPREGSLDYAAIRVEWINRRGKLPVEHGGGSSPNSMKFAQYLQAYYTQPFPIQE